MSYLSPEARDFIGSIAGPMIIALSAALIVATAKYDDWSSNRRYARERARGPH